MSWWRVPLTDEEWEVSGAFPRGESPVVPLPSRRSRARRSWSLRYSEDQPREDNGRFGSGSSTGSASVDKTAEDARAALSPADQAALNNWEVAFDNVVAIQENPNGPQAEAFKEAIDKMPAATEDTFRGVGYLGEGVKPEVGQTWTFSVPVSTSANESTSEQFGHTIIEFKGGGDSHMLGNDMQEAVQMPGSFRVASVEQVSVEPRSTLHAIGMGDTDTHVVLERTGDVPWKATSFEKPSRPTIRSNVRSKSELRSTRRFVSRPGDPGHPVITPAHESLRYSEDQPRDEHGRFGSGGGDSKTAAPAVDGAHAVGVSADPNSMSLHTVTGPQQPGESDRQYNDRLFRDGQEKYAPALNVNAAADNYRESVGLPIPAMPDGGSWTTLEAPVEREKECGDAFAALKSNPDDPEVQRAYADLVAQSQEQWDYLTKPESEGGAGIKVDFVSPQDIKDHYGDKEGLNPYPTAAAQRNDLVDNHHLAIASIADYPEAYHPILSNTRGGEYDTFRAVHDSFGHAAVGADFTRHGEFQAWAHHSSMFYGPGQRAASTELTGENSFLITHHEPAGHVAALLPEKLSTPPFDAASGDYKGPSFYRSRGRRIPLGPFGGESEIVKKFGVVNSRNALFGKIAAERPAKESLRYSDDQPREDNGRFGSGGGTDTADNRVGAVAWADSKFPPSDRYTPETGGVAFRTVSPEDHAQITASGQITSNFTGMGPQAPGVYLAASPRTLVEYGSPRDAVLAVHLNAGEAHITTTPGVYRADSLPADRIVGTYGSAKRSYSLRYSEDQPRDADGRFGSGGGSTASAAPSPKEIDSQIAGLKAINVGNSMSYGTFKGQTDTPISGIATNYYVSPNGEHAINGELRHPGNESDARAPHSKEDLRIAQGYARDIEGSMGKSKQDSVAYRGIVVPEGQAGFKTGDTFTDRGLVSLSSDKEVATAFAEGRASGTITFPASMGDTLPVDVPRVAGTPTTLAVMVPKGSSGRTGEADIKETILPRDTTFHVLGTGTDGTVLVRAQETGMP